MAASPMPPVSDPITATATAENEILSPAERPLNASPGPPRRSSFLPSSTTASSISAGDFVAAMTVYVTADPRPLGFPYYGDVVPKYRRRCALGGEWAGAILPKGLAASHQVFYLASRNHGDVEVLFPLGGQLQDRGVTLNGEDHDNLGMRRLQPV